MNSSAGQDNVKVTVRMQVKLSHHKPAKEHLGMAEIE
jgi:hypothetical protein